MTATQRKVAMALRRAREYPWHGPPHFDAGEGCYHIWAPCYEHRPLIGEKVERMAEFESALLDACGARSTVEGASSFVVPTLVGPFSSALGPIAWCVLPNHYHLLIATKSLRETVAALGRLHGRLSYVWNGEDAARGRKVWHRCGDRAIRGERHFWANMNYVHHNPVKHGLVERWQDWPFSSARVFLETMGRKDAARIWEEYPIDDYGKGWDN